MSLGLQVRVVAYNGLGPVYHPTWYIHQQHTPTTYHTHTPPTMASITFDEAQFDNSMAVLLPSGNVWSAPIKRNFYVFGSNNVSFDRASGKTQGGGGGAASAPPPASPSSSGQELGNFGAISYKSDIAAITVPAISVSPVELTKPVELVCILECSIMEVTLKPRTYYWRL